MCCAFTYYCTIFILWWAHTEQTHSSLVWCFTMADTCCNSVFTCTVLCVQTWHWIKTKKEKAESDWVTKSIASEVTQEVQVSNQMAKVKGFCRCNKCLWLAYFELVKREVIIDRPDLPKWTLWKRVSRSEAEVGDSSVGLEEIGALSSIATRHDCCWQSSELGKEPKSHIDTLAPVNAFNTPWSRGPGSIVPTFLIHGNHVIINVCCFKMQNLC